MTAQLTISPLKIEQDGYSYERSGVYLCKRGIVLIYVMRWATNFAPHIWTQFKTVAHGELVTEYWHTADFTDKTLQVKAARFLHKALKPTH